MTVVDPSTLVPIRKVVLFKHGISYIEREGQVDNDKQIDLYFKASEMNDVLKSLTVMDLNDGIISSISYQANQSVSDQLKDIEITIPEKSSLTGLLNQTKGGRVRFTSRSKEVIEGLVLGTETFVIQQSGVRQEIPHVNLFVDGGSIRSVSLLDYTGIEFLDEHLKKDMQHVLQTLISGKKKDSKQLTIFASGEGARKVFISYIIESPVWKTSYRMLLPKLNEENPSTIATLQGWAMVDNTSDEDWENVQLTLVAGLPISFTHDLYNPRFKSRPEIKVEEEPAYAPPILEQVRQLKDRKEDEKKKCKSAVRSFAGLRMAESASISSSEARAVVREKQAEQVQVRNVEIGDLFSYEIAHGVTVRRNGAALVPIYQGSISASRIAVYNQTIRDKNPMSSLLVKNTTPATLEGGPITVLENESYVGEAMLDTIKPGEEKILPYSVELGCKIRVEPLQQSNFTKIHQVKIVDGVLYQYNYSLHQVKYIIDNSTNEKPIDLHLEHQFQGGYELYDTEIRPYETTQNFYRFKLGLVAKKSSQEFIVKERKLSWSQVSLSSTNKKTVSSWLTSGYISSEIKKQIDVLVDMNTKLTNAEKDLNKCTAELNTEVNSQTRIRNNLASLTSKDDQKARTKFVNELAESENKIVALQTETQRLQKVADDIRRQKNEYLSTINFSKDISV